MTNMYYNVLPVLIILRYGATAKPQVPEPLPFTDTDPKAGPCDPVLRWETYPNEYHLLCDLKCNQRRRSVAIEAEEFPDKDYIKCLETGNLYVEGIFISAAFQTCSSANMKTLAEHRVVFNDKLCLEKSYVCRVRYYNESDEYYHSFKSKPCRISAKNNGTKRNTVHIMNNSTDSILLTHDENFRSSLLQMEGYGALFMAIFAVIAGGLTVMVIYAVLSIWVCRRHKTLCFIKERMTRKTTSEDIEITQGLPGYEVLQKQKTRCGVYADLKPVPMLYNKEKPTINSTATNCQFGDLHVYHELLASHIAQTGDYSTVNPEEGHYTEITLNQEKSNGC